MCSSAEGSALSGGSRSVLHDDQIIKIAILLDSQSPIINPIIIQVLDLGRDRSPKVLQRDRGELGFATKQSTNRALST